MMLTLATCSTVISTCMLKIIILILKNDDTWWNEEKKKTEHTNIARSSLNFDIKIFTSCCLMQKYDHNKHHSNNIAEIKLRMLKLKWNLFERYDVFAWKKKKNGAHKHLSSSLTSLASKYSRHVVLCKNNTFKCPTKKHSDLSNDDR